MLHEILCVKLTFLNLLRANQREPHSKSHMRLETLRSLTAYTLESIKGIDRDVQL